MTDVTREFLQQLPKAELHIHLEGTLEPDLKLKLAKKNHINIGQNTIEEVKKSYQFDDLASFLAVYYPALAVLQTEQDFYDLAYAYLLKAKDNHVRHVELFFDPQAHTSRGISFETVINGFYRATQDAKSFGVDAQLIMCFLRDFSKESARQTLLEAKKHRDKILGIGLDSDEHHNPPMKFATHFENAVSQGYHITMHCDIDQVDSIDHIKQALEVIGVERLDHGTNIVENSDLVDFVNQKQIGMTTCPKSNSFVSADMKGKEITDLLAKGIEISVNSDDPAYFGGYISENYWALAEAYDLSVDQVVQIAKNSFNSSWISDQQKRNYVQEIDDFVANYDFEREIV